jgi:aspartyl-tRNA(Asn)/glutamyl-tRNA(Gln) amidotransferase subunit B
VHPPRELVEKLHSEIGESPGARIRRIADTLSFYDADVLVMGGLDHLWSAVVEAGAEPKEAANVLANQFVATGVSPDAVDAGELAKLVSARAAIPRAAFDEALAKVGDAGFSAGPYLEQKVVADASELDPVIERIVAANPSEAEQYRGGKQGLLGFFVGQVMKETGGKADPRVVNERVKMKLEIQELGS